MGGFTRWVVVSLLALGLALACTDSGSDPGLGATVPRAAPSSTSTAPPADPYAVPAVIDAAYLNRVFEALEQVDGDVARLVAREHSLPPEAAARLRAIYDDDELQRQINSWLDLIATSLDRLRNPPSNRVTRVSTIISGSSTCVFAAVTRDFSGTAVNAPPPIETFIALRRNDAGRDPRRVNPTPWIVDFAGARTGGERPDDPC